MSSGFLFYSHVSYPDLYSQRGKHQSCWSELSQVTMNCPVCSSNTWAKGMFWSVTACCWHSLPRCPSAAGTLRAEDKHYYFIWPWKSCCFESCQVNSVFILARQRWYFIKYFALSCISPGKTSQRDEATWEEREIIAWVILNNSTFIYAGELHHHTHIFTPGSHSCIFNGFDRNRPLNVDTDPYNRAGWNISTRNTNNIHLQSVWAVTTEKWPRLKVQPDSKQP